MRHRNSEKHAGRGKRDRRAGLHRFPAPFALGAGRHPDAAGRYTYAAFIAMRALGINSNIMSLGGIAIAIGAMIDAAS
jgi:hypothetical protein